MKLGSAEAEVTTLTLEAGDTVAIDSGIRLHIFSVEQRGSDRNELGVIKIGVDAPLSTRIFRGEIAPGTKT